MEAFYWISGIILIVFFTAVGITLCKGSKLREKAWWNSQWLEQVNARKLEMLRQDIADREQALYYIPLLQKNRGKIYRLYAEIDVCQAQIKKILEAQK